MVSCHKPILATLILAILTFRLFLSSLSNRRDPDTGIPYGEARQLEYMFEHRKGQFWVVQNVRIEEKQEGGGGNH